MPATRHVSTTLTSQVAAPAEIVFSIAVADGPTLNEEKLTVTVDGNALVVDEVAAEHGGRLHVVRNTPVGALELQYEATVTGHAKPSPMSTIDGITYLRPSRYSDSDVLFPMAQAEFGDVTGKQLVDAISSWVGAHLTYVSGSSRAIDGAVDTLLARQGVCRDYAHLVVALLRARGVPARLVSVYAPGLQPMDFHAVAEVYVEGGWYVVDATCLAPRSSMLRIATGRDAADTAFMTVHSGIANLGTVTVSAVVEPELPGDDLTQLVRLG